MPSENLVSSLSSHGSNDSILETPLYTRRLKYKPRSGESGKFQFPPLKQNPWSIIMAWNDLSDMPSARDARWGTKIAWRLSDWQAHLSKTKIPRKWSIFLTQLKLESPK